jgi:hypothetical protein
MSEKKTNLQMAEELDAMDDDVTSLETDLLERALKTLRAGRGIEPKDEGRLEAMYEKYLGEGTEEAPSEDPEEEIGPDA